MEQNSFRDLPPELFVHFALSPIDLFVLRLTSRENAAIFSRYSFSFPVDPNSNERGYRVYHIPRIEEENDVALMRKEERQYFCGEEFASTAVRCGYSYELIETLRNELHFPLSTAICFISALEFGNMSVINALSHHPIIKDLFRAEGNHFSELAARSAGRSGSQAAISAFYSLYDDRTMGPSQKHYNITVSLHSGIFERNHQSFITASFFPYLFPEPIIGPTLAAIASNNIDLLKYFFDECRKQLPFALHSEQLIKAALVNGSVQALTFFLHYDHLDLIPLLINISEQDPSILVHAAYNSTVEMQQYLLSNEDIKGIVPEIFPKDRPLFNILTSKRKNPSMFRENIKILPQPLSKPFLEKASRALLSISQVFPTNCERYSYVSENMFPKQESHASIYGNFYFNDRGNPLYAFLDFAKLLLPNDLVVQASSRVDLSIFLKVTNLANVQDDMEDFQRRGDLVRFQSFFGLLDYCIESDSKSYEHFRPPSSSWHHVFQTLVHFRVSLIYFRLWQHLQKAKEKAVIDKNERDEILGAFLDRYEASLVEVALKTLDRPLSLLVGFFELPFMKNYAIESPEKTRNIFLAMIGKCFDYRKSGDAESELLIAPRLDFLFRQFSQFGIWRELLLFRSRRFLELISHLPSIRECYSEKSKIHGFVAVLKQVRSSALIPPEILGAFILLFISDRNALYTEVEQEHSEDLLRVFLRIPGLKSTELRDKVEAFLSRQT